LIGFGIDSSSVTMHFQRGANRMIAARATREELPVPSDRSFGVIASIFFLLVACLPLFSGRDVRYWALIPALLCGIIAIVKPAVLHYANVAWTRFGQLLHSIVNPVILAFLFFVVLVPFGMVVRICRKELLQLKFNPNADSYWVRPEKSDVADKSMINQF
jgi:hypothetical protein